MCIIIYAPAKKQVKKEFICKAYDNNPDGAGVMYYDKKGAVKYKKGFFTFDSLYKFWQSLDVNKPRALHCRIATSGKISAGCCHPFPICDDLEAMTVDSGTSGHGCLMHNGVFMDYTPKEGMKSPYSDTMFYTKDLIYPILPVINNSSVLKLLGEMTSRVILFLPNQKVLRFGDWTEDKDGFYASNTTYKYEKTLLSGCYGYGSYGGWSDAEYENSYTPDAIRKRPQPKFYLSIEFQADDRGQAEDRLYEILDMFYGIIYDEDYTFNSLIPIGKDYWTVTFETYEDIRASLPTDIFVSGFFDYTTAEGYGTAIEEGMAGNI